MMICIVYGTEPWIMRKQKEWFRKKCPDPVYGYQEGDDLADARAFLLSYNLFTERLYYYLTVEDSKGLMAKETLRFFEELKEDIFRYLLIEVKKVTDKDCGIAKLKDTGIAVAAYPKLTSAFELQKQVELILRQQGAVMEPEAVKVMMERLDYKNHEETNLVTVENYVGQLKYLGNPVTVDDVVRNTPDFREGKRFRLAALIASGDRVQLLAEAARLKAEHDFSAFGLLGILQKEYRVAYLAQLGFSLKEQGVFVNNFKNFSERELVRGLEILSEAFQSIRMGVYGEGEAFDLALAHLICKV